MALYSVRSERLFCEQLDYNLLFRWFLDMDMDEPSPDHSTFSKNRERLLEHDVAGRFFAAVVEQARKAKLMSDEHFTVDGTLIEAWASLKSFRPKGEEQAEAAGRPGQPDRQLPRREAQQRDARVDDGPGGAAGAEGHSKEAKLSYSAHALMENRNGLLVDFQRRAATALPSAARHWRCSSGSSQRIAARSPSAATRATTRELHRGLPRARRHAARGADVGRAPELRDRRPDGAAPGLRHQPAHPEARRGDLRLDEDGRRLPQDAVPRPSQDAARRRTSSEPPTTCSESRGYRPHERVQQLFGWAAPGLRGAEGRPNHQVGGRRSCPAAFLNTLLEGATGPGLEGVQDQLLGVRHGLALDETRCALEPWVKLSGAT